jgi:glutamate-1-semialdehyde 2,1-aminomutase
MANKTSTLTNSPLRQRAELAIAHGALTNSKRPQCFIKGVYPTHLQHGAGCKLFDGKNSYFDFICGLGTNLLGYAHGEVTDSMHSAMVGGASLSLSSQLEVSAAERVKELFPFIDRLRFLKTGSDACSASVKIARAFTGKKHVYSEGYHGHNDEFVGLSPPHLGVIPSHYMHPLPANFHDMASDTAAVIVEPVMTEMTDARRAWLNQLRDFCSSHNIVLIFDEVITGFRVPGMSIATHWGIKPDLICLGKAIANGMPLSVVGGRLDIMECGEYFISSTYAGERVSLAAALKVMNLLDTKYRIQELWDAGAKFQKRFNALEPTKLQINGYPTRGVFVGDKLVKDLFWQESIKAGMLFGSSFFFNFPHIAISDFVLSACEDIFRRIRMGAVQLEGEPSASPFAQQMREKAHA